ncbi:hypothetical protein MKZ38_004898 [Zalerion maritima]|uniref:Mitochondrial import inner membrane translocase subunit n=1 Tax=Zalerion maritima TaxID=339359 RepID=A0AAD5RX52_9PEZI|nr:hypothetical protein MKZ38_004898 [Zalerion maritima]
MSDAPDLSSLDSQLTATDKSELQTFLNHTRQRSEIQQRTHVMTDMCFKKCVTGIKSASLDRTEEACLSNCLDRFYDVAKLTVQHLQSHRG